ncbi:hypothetical protein [Flavobacterium album]|uniref:hypothetical protein n=1 Tax=Flavobacterium album TaxID=2175091 RepID=UPI001FEC4A3E|nr:hypothetical protein [Flavobacterium album]
MKKLYALKNLLFLSLFITLTSCGDDEEYIKVSPVQLDLSAVPYAKLSDYKFFEGDMKDQQPAYKVLPYDLNSALFTDYAHKKRFVWMPDGATATFTADSEILNFPVGTVLIKTFYYDNVQPANTTRIIETRLLIKRQTSGYLPITSGMKTKPKRYSTLKAAIPMYRGARTVL